MVPFVAVLTCIDGRVLPPTLAHMGDMCDAEHVDVITAPGMDGLLAGGGAAADGALRALEVSMVAHGTRDVVVVGHDDCAGHPADPAERGGIVARAVEAVLARHPTLSVTGLHLRQEAAGWQADEVLSALRS